MGLSKLFSSFFLCWATSLSGRCLTIICLCPFFVFTTWPCHKNAWHKVLFGYFEAISMGIVNGCICLECATTFLFLLQGLKKQHRSQIWQQCRCGFFRYNLEFAILLLSFRQNYNISILTIKDSTGNEIVPEILWSTPVWDHKNVSQSTSEVVFESNTGPTHFLKPS